ncbi:GGDEF domain-containing protein [Thiomicrospira sp. R3]|uniref:GGDEF domain-containing protein n=1 Tax=Thiomicrospira sp. R3 TaxID=3035472 RepID=UPI00259BEA94|nr:GGDEF domain-containing protein [Thiomicrospira sp. R3]WFE69313.1 GGDEF domain-containing protein [Thiomicrospira sp. R3]
MNMQPDTFEKAQKIFKHITDIFEEKQINPSPINYLVWYSYFKGDKPKLRQELDLILQDPFGYNDRAGRRLYAEHLDDDQEQSDLDKLFKRLLDAMMKKLTAWTNKLESSTEQFDKYTKDLSNNTLNQDELKSLTHSMINTTAQMRDHNQTFQQELMTALTEIQRLKRQLLEARAESMQDELTQLGNRKAFNLAIEELTTQEPASSLFLIMTDIDHFKSFNDRFGHLVGDSVLRYLANILRKEQKPNLTNYRYGGEEFAILIKDTDLEQVKNHAETLRQDLQKVHLKRKDTGEVLPDITASFGIAQYRQYEPIDDFIKRADDMLYRAKQQGRNCIVSEFDDSLKQE